MQLRHMEMEMTDDILRCLLFMLVVTQQRKNIDTRFNMEQMEFRSQDIMWTRNGHIAGPWVCAAVGHFTAVMWNVGAKHLGGRCHCCHHDACFSSAQCGAWAVLDLMVRPITEETEVVG